MRTLCDTHAHTIASTHAFSTVHDYFAVARAKGLQLFSITDHAPAMPDAPHYWHFGNMKIIPRVMDGVAMLRGIEANILPPGKHKVQVHKDLQFLDIPANLVPFLDITIASFHEPVFPPGSDIKGNTQAAIAAFESGLCQVFGHPGNPNYPLEQEEIVRAAKDNNVAIEINNSSFTHSRLGSENYCIRLLELVDKHDWKVVFASDAHIAWAVGDHEQCIAKAQAADFPEHRVLSTSPHKLLAFLSEHGKGVEKELSSWLKSLPVQATD